MTGIMLSARLCFIAWWLVLGSVVSAYDGTYAPYTNGLVRGQGYNTYSQSGCMDGAVTVKGASKPSTAVNVTYYSEQITEYSELAKVLDISASASVSYLGNSASFEAKYLDRSTFDESFLTYVVVVDVQKQPQSDTQFAFNWNNATDPTQRYCDRFISDFVTGGALFARVSIHTTDSSKHNEIEAAAKAAFGIYGVEGEVSASVKSQIDVLQKNSLITTSWFTVGAPPSYVEGNAGGDDGPILAIKKLADDFVNKAGDHNWIRYALLEEYKDVYNFREEFEPLDYAEASDLSWQVFDDYSKYQSYQTAIKTIDPSHFINGTRGRTELLSKASTALQKYRDWLNSVERTPSVAMSEPDVPPMSDFCTFASDTFKTTRYTAQNYHTTDHFIDTKIRPDIDSTLFSFKAFDFEGVPGTMSIQCGEASGLDFSCAPELGGYYTKYLEFWTPKEQVGPFKNELYKFHGNYNSRSTQAFTLNAPDAPEWLESPELRWTVNVV